MRKTLVAFHAFASRLFCLGAVSLSLTSLILSGCGGGAGNTGGDTTTTVTSVTLSPATTTVAPGGSASFTASVAGANNPSQAVTWSVSPTSAGTISGGAFTASSTITSTTSAQVCATSTVPGYTSIQGCASVTINPVAPPPPTITSVSTGATSATVAPGQTDTITPAVVGTGSYTNTVNISVNPSTAGTLSASSNVPSGTPVTFTASASITTATQVTITSCSTMAGYTTVCGPTTITINPVAPPPPTVTSVTLTCSPTSITTAQSSTCVVTVHYSDGTTSTKATFALASGSVGSVNSSTGVYSSASAGTGNVVATSTENTSISSSPFAITVTTVVTPPTITSVSLQCTSTSITNIQTTTCTPQVAGTGAYTNTVNLTLTPASAGTLSASTNVASGTSVTFTPTFNTGAQTPTITATSTEDSTKSSGAVEITVTLRTITINSPTGNIWLADCSALVFYSVAQTGIVNGDTVHVDPYQPGTFTTTPGSTFTVSLGIGNNNGPNGINPCSPGAYDQYVSGTDSARSNDVYIPILSPWNIWAGYNSTDEFQADFASNTTWKYKLTDGTPDGSIPSAGLITLVDGNNLISGNLGNGSLSVYNITTGTQTSGVNDSGGNFVGAAAKNGIVGYTTTSPSLSFSMEQLNSPNLATLQNVGTAPTAIAMSTGCNTNPNAASAFTYDQAGSTLYRSDAVGDTSNYTVTASLANQVTLSGFSPASALPANLARYVVAWDSSCKAVVIAPVTTGGTNPDGTTAYVMELALVDMTSGSARQLGTYVSTGIPSTAIRMAADPSGNDVVIASTNQAAGTTVLTKVSWTLDANENPTFTVTTLASAPPTGVYGVSLGILPSNLVPNGTVIRVGQRQQHYALASQ